ncbi:MAG: S9 family peptidase [Candidatus Marinimicrobia bacterium]|nr:S9 family peptidase [Candidatus Neomarinimicrobiota bacterium]
MRNFVLVLLFATMLVAGALARPMNFEDLINCKRISDPVYSPDCNLIAFTFRKASLEANDYSSSIRVINMEGNEMFRIESDSFSVWNPKWSPDGKKLAYLSDESETPQIWFYYPDRDEKKQFTTHYTGVNDFIWSHNGSKIAFDTRVYPECKTQKANKKRDEKEDKSEVNVRVYEELLFRHWDEWWDHKRSHIFVIDTKNRNMLDVTPGNYDVPPISLGYGYTFAPDDKKIYFTSNHDEVVATSTNNDIWSVPVEGGEVQLVTDKCNDRDFAGSDYSPRFSPNGRYLAFISMRRAGYESDKHDLFIKDMIDNKFIKLTDNFNYSISSFQWMPNSRALLCRVDQEGNYKLFKLDIDSKEFTLLVEEGYNKSVDIASSGDEFIYLHNTFTRPSEIFRYSIKKDKADAITAYNEDRFAKVDMNSAEEFWYKGANNVDVHGFLIKPPNFNPNKKYPMVYMVHGGPQGAWHNGWHYRWNLELWAAQGYVLVLINPRGSTGYGQKFKFQISKDWGGKVFTDLIKGQEYVIENYEFINQDNIAAAGASFGGYMMNWFEGHMDEFKYPFKTLINHDGAFNLYSKYLTTEELWFPEWEFDGPFWENEKYYKKFSPHNYIENFQTPMLIIHGEKDFRLDFGEGLMPFTALRRKGIPAKLVLFPEEGHWVQKPKNSEFWHATIFDWLDKYIGK